MRVFVEQDAERLSCKASDAVAQLLLANPNSSLALPTGRTPLGLYRELVRLHREENLDFSRAMVFNLDEYIGVPPSDPRSFDHYLRQHFLSKVNVLPANVHLQSHSADSTACAEYEARIQAAGGIDLVIAGVGTNGHIAFNEPGAALDSRTRIVELADTTRSNMLAVFRREEMPRHAVTMGIGTILEARKILVLATGHAKQRALASLLHGPVTPDSPVSSLRVHRDVTVIADREAAARKSG